MNANDLLQWLQNNQLISPIEFRKPLIMGIVNTTADSFSDGGYYLTTEKAIEHALHLIEGGADIIDIGGESSKPGVEQIPLEIEIGRVIPVIKGIRQHTKICISIDTYKPEVMKAAVEAGANLINDIYALRQEGALSMAAQLAVPVCLMHMQGHPKTMQESPEYKNGVLCDIREFFTERIMACQNAGIAKQNLLLDPGFGFGKTVNHNMMVLKQLKELQQFKIPLLLGVSRKSTIGFLLNKKVDERLIGSIALAVYAALQGIGILRVHDVDETNQALRIIEAIYHN